MVQQDQVLKTEKGCEIIENIDFIVSLTVNQAVDDIGLSTPYVSINIVKIIGKHQKTSLTTILDIENEVFYLYLLLTINLMSVKDIEKNKEEEDLGFYILVKIRIATLTAERLDLIGY